MRKLRKMRKLNVGLIRVVTTEDKEILNSHGRLLCTYFDNLNIETKCIPDQPEGIHDAETEKIAVPKIIKLAKEFEERGADAVFISCAADPAVEECREILSIPVIGAGSSCAAMAYILGKKIGVLGITEKAPEVMTKILNEKLVLSVKPEGVNTTLDLFGEDGKKKVLEAAAYIKEKGCDTIALACTGMSTIKIFKEIEQRLQIRVIDPVLAAGLFISYLQF